MMNSFSNSTCRLTAARRPLTRAILACSQLFSLFLFSTIGMPTAVYAEAQPGTIAYVAPNDTTGDQIWLIEPDGSHDRYLWDTGVKGASGVEDISGLAWHPQAQELSFASRAEDDCSFYGSDIYSIRPDGSHFRRVTAPPDCYNTAGLPTGTVSLTIFNYTPYAGPFTVYFEGAPGPQIVPVDPYASADITFEDVADYGERIQWAVVALGEDRYTSVSANADVIPGQTVDSGSISMLAANADWSWSYPSWKSDGSRIAYLLDMGIPYAIPADNDIAGEIGDPLFNIAGERPLYDPDFLTWGPQGVRSKQLLYTGWDAELSGETIYQATEGDEDAGTPLVYVDQGVGRVVLGLAWLPDGSGFLYSQTEGYGQYGNIYEYDFEAGEAFRVTDFSEGYPRRLSISPDGSQVVYEYQAKGEWTDIYADLDLWMMNCDGSEQSLFVENGREPAWSLTDLPEPLVLDRSLFLPAILAR